MSQEKIDRYKEEKANRKKDAAKQKRVEVISKIVTVVVIIGLLGWIGWSGYRSYEQGKEEQSLREAWLEQYSSMLAATTATSGVNLEQSPSNMTKENDDSSDESSETEDESTSAAEDEKESE